MSTHSMPFPPGTVLAGKYRVERLLGEGGMGWVVQAVHLQLDQRVALKFMRASSASESPEGVARFLREARAAARIQSDHVARVSDVGTLPETGAPYLVMEYLEGQDLDSLLRGRPVLPVSEALNYALQACEGLAEAHAAGIIHRDLKPANLFLARKSDGSVRVKLLDFGISKLSPPTGRTSDGAKTGTQNLMGSPLYMAPEQMRSSKNVDRRADIWSMGIILYEMLSGRSPFTGDTLPEICARILADAPPSLRTPPSDVSPELEAVVFACLEKEPERRLADVATLARALSNCGPPDLRVTADRIARLLRIDSSSLPDVTLGPGVPRAVAASSFVAQTNASFGSPASPARPRRSSTTAIGVTAALAAAVLVVGGMVATRGKHADAPAVSAGSAITQGSPLVSAPAVTLAPAPVISAAPGEPTVASAPAAAASPVTQRPSSAPPPSMALAGPTHTPSAATRPIQKPKAAPILAKPSATTGFGGRD
jgi:eukaryotic-like serine/threonine-protein kinase